MLVFSLLFQQHANSKNLFSKNSSILIKVLTLSHSLIRPLNNYVFYLELLEVEERHSDILKHLTNKFNWQDSRSAQILTIAAKYFPGEAFGMVEMQAEQLLDSGQRGRDVYGNIAKWLAALKSNPDLHKAVLAFTKALVTGYNRLPALKDELRSQKLSF
jgi:hypothetical protein